MAEAKKDAPKDGMAELHDNVNVVIMLATFAASALSLAGLPPGHVAVVYGSIAYTLVDGLWIAARPRMVATPVGIVAHHVVVLGMLYGPIEIPAHGLYASCALLVELNTALNTIRRKLGHPKWAELGFLATWVGFRLVMYPALAGMLTVSYLTQSKSWSPLARKLLPVSGCEAAIASWHEALLFCLICVFQFYWTFALGKGFLKRMKKKE
jgi:hypothetical protein